MPVGASKTPLTSNRVKDMIEVKVNFKSSGLWISGGELNIDRGMLASKADELDRMVMRLRAMSRGLRHAVACPAPSHAACPSFQRLLKAASSGALENRQRVLGLRRGA